MKCTTRKRKRERKKRRENIRLDGQGDEIYRWKVWVCGWVGRRHRAVEEVLKGEQCGRRLPVNKYKQRLKTRSSGEEYKHRQVKKQVNQSNPPGRALFMSLRYPVTQHRAEKWCKINGPCLLQVWWPPIWV